MGEDDFKTKSGKGRRNSGTYVTCLQFHGSFNGASNGGIQVLKAGKIGKPQIFHERRGFGVCKTRGRCHGESPSDGDE